MANSLEELMKQLQEKVSNSAKSDMKNDVVDVYKENITKHVYEAYDPIEYDRRYSLLQDQNIKSDTEKNKDGIALKIWNEAPYNPEYGGTPADLPELIEYGDGYNGNYYDYPFDSRYTRPRPYTEKTKENLEETGKHIESLKKSLRSKGLDVR